MKPLQGWCRLSSELAVEHGLLVLQHHLIFRSDHGTRETLICRRWGTNVRMITSAIFTVSFIKTCQQRGEAGGQSGGLQVVLVCVNTSEAQGGTLMRSVIRPCSISTPPNPLLLCWRLIQWRYSLQRLYEVALIQEPHCHSHSLFWLQLTSAIST